MKKQKFFFSLLSIFILSLSLALTGCGKKEAPPAEGDLYGVADLETLVKAHPKYSQYFKEESDYKQLLQQYENERNHLIDISSRQEKLTSAMNNESIRMQAQAELQNKVAAKQNELNAHLNYLYNEISKKHQLQTNGNELFTPLSQDQQIQLANLQLKLTVVGVTGKEKEEIKQQIHDLMDSQMKKSPDESQWSQEEVEQMAKAKEEAAAELNEYSNQAAEEIKVRLSSETAQAPNASASSVPSDWDQVWQKRIQDKQNAMAELKKEIMDDIRKQASYVGEQKHLTMIFCEYKANIDAEDVTGDIVSRLVSGENQ